ncbi:uncharacterized protein B0P05DRAFT_523327 [Gilbertella persicaria]|uniref:uncharacterized protein n=1 Tax=Gilbertella persicaria TaxID=101096 RepID=UPI00221EBF01|nr:uncharacterized protein B0P05DRAFT_523327 [Gilbertella persicaria]KAI8098080.1 hypothetical protein B0P05DRAFT_523327 [Gilbertella persicaria]
MKMSAHNFTIVSTPGKRISLEKASHPCPKCRHQASVQLIRSERQWIVFNKCISNSMRVRYECSKCRWKNEELPSYPNEFNRISNDDFHFQDTDSSSSVLSDLY